jgi:Leucine-rich repeat (LRR) protein
MSTYSIETLTFAFNSISIIEFDAFYYLKSLIDLSLAHNELSLVEKNNFFYLNSLKYLNLSHNRISFIEHESFVNLNKLIALDLSFNRGLLVALESNVFLGLSYLNELHLVSYENETVSLKLNNGSFSHLINIGNIYLDESIIVENKCLFMHTIVRDIKRSIANRFKFYKALNLISPPKGRTLVGSRAQS